MTSDVSSLYFCERIKLTIVGMEAGIYKVAPRAYDKTSGDSHFVNGCGFL